MLYTLYFYIFATLLLDTSMTIQRILFEHLNLFLFRYVYIGRNAYDALPPKSFDRK